MLHNSNEDRKLSWIDKPLEWNVLDEDAYKERSRKVFNQTANALEKSLGPYGANTILEQWGETHFTKDGWQILKKLHFADNIDNTLKMLLVNISAQVVNKVGDGTTSSIAAANQLLKKLESDPVIKKMRPRDLQERLLRLIKQVGDVIIKNANKIDPETDPEFEQIYRLAMISTNGDEVVSRALQSIYKETKNPSVDFVKSKDNRTYYEVIEGYQGPICLLNDVFMNDEENRTCNVNHPLILVFDHAVTMEIHLRKILPQVMNYAMSQNRRVVVVAPHYDRYALTYFSKFINAEIMENGTTIAVYARAGLINNATRDNYRDFAMMAGATVVTEADLEDLVPMEEGSVPERNILEFIGSVDSITLTPENSFKTVIRGFHSRNENLYNLAVTDATSKYKLLEEKNNDLNIVSMELMELKRRMIRLTGKIGTIYVGGSSSLEKTANYDLVEDAVKACESAFNYGYSIGGNMSISLAINEILSQNVVTDPEDVHTLELIRDAFQRVFIQVMRNRDRDITEEDAYEIINTALQNGACYDLITDTYNPNIINPCYTDVEILKAATSIVGLLITSNQFVTIYRQD